MENRGVKEKRSDSTVSLSTSLAANTRLVQLKGTFRPNEVDSKQWSFKGHWKYKLDGEDCWHGFTYEHGTSPLEQNNLKAAAIASTPTPSSAIGVLNVNPQQENPQAKTNSLLQVRLEPFKPPEVETALTAETNTAPTEAKTKTEEATAETENQEAPPMGEWNGNFLLSRGVIGTNQTNIVSIKEKYKMTINEDIYNDHDRSIIPTSSSIDDINVKFDGANRYGSFSVLGYINIKSGNFLGVKYYNVNLKKRSPRPARIAAGYDGHIDKDAIRASKRARTPNPRVRENIGADTYGLGLARTKYAVTLKQHENLPPIPNPNSKRGRARLKIRKFVTTLPYYEFYPYPEISPTAKSVRSSSFCAGSTTPDNNTSLKTPRSKAHKKQPPPSHSSNTTPVNGGSRDAAHSFFTDALTKITAVGEEWHKASNDKQDEVYEGDYYNGERHGFGTCAFATGEIYQGQWLNGREHGNGKLLNSIDELLYTGEYQDGKIHGVGIYYYTNGDQYNGEFREGFRQGRGVYKEPNGSYYDGEWVRNKRSGYGVFMHANGSVYEGEWNDDLRHGKGILTLADGFTYEGLFKDGAICGRGVCVYPDGGRYEGSFKLGVKDGRGTYTFTNGSVYEGRFRNDKLDGTGTLKMKEGCSVQVSSDLWMIPLYTQAEMRFVHLKAGFSEDGT